MSFRRHSAVCLYHYRWPDVLIILEVFRIGQMTSDISSKKQFLSYVTGVKIADFYVSLRNTCLAAQEIIMLNVKKEIYLVKNRGVCT